MLTPRGAAIVVSSDKNCRYNQQIITETIYDRHVFPNCKNKTALLRLYLNLFSFFFAPAALPRCQSVALDKDPKQSSKR